MYTRMRPDRKQSLTFRLKTFLPFSLAVLCAPSAFANPITLPLYDLFNGFLPNQSTQLPALPATFNAPEDNNFSVTFAARSPLTSSQFYSSSSGGYLYGQIGNTSEIDITYAGGYFSFASVVEWAFQGSSDAVLQLFGYNGSTLVGSETFNLSSPNPQNPYSYGSALQSATQGGLLGQALTELVIYPDFTAPPTNQAGLSNLTLDTTPGEAPEPGTLSLLLVAAVGIMVLKAR